MSWIFMRLLTALMHCVWDLPPHDALLSTQLNAAKTCHLPCLLVVQRMQVHMQPQHSLYTVLHACFESAC